MPRPSASPLPPLRLGLVLFPGCMPAGLFAAADMVRACNLRAGRDLVLPTWVGADRQAVPTWQGPALQPQATLAGAGCDAWLVPGLWLSSADELAPALQQHRGLVAALRALPRSSALWSYCAGVALVAASGRLDGKAATATWWLQGLLVERFARVHWRPGESLVADGRTLSASGPGGYLPLMLDRLSARYGAAVLRDVQEVLMLPQPRLRHAAFHAVEIMRLRDPDLRQLLVFAQGTAARDLDLAVAARQMNTSVRTLCRKVRQATGLPAGEWLRRVKLRQVGEALCQTRLPLKHLAGDLGFSSESGLHRAFKSVTGLSPAAYRQTYGTGTLV
ncbi:MAG TPA: helix-turn-helix domain-containing protein [Burkholderiaceae bacterium]|nr:helix-turn-helix domain-containing protein [Burkholderiaceae bacterium]